MTQQCTGIIIDDESDQREIMSDYFMMRGFNIVGTGINGCQADKLFKEKQPDFVILDLNMPDYDGKYAIEKIKEHNSQAKIFVVTGCDTCSFEESTVEAVFKKPIHMTELKDMIFNSVCNS